MEHRKVVQEYYSKRVADYDAQKTRTWKSNEGFASEILNEVATALADLEHKRVLEVGVGSGRIALPLLKKNTPWLVGIDLSKEMLKLAKEKMRHYKKNFDLILSDGERLPFTNNAFDALICISTIHYFTFPERSLTEFSRTLKGKGVFVYGDLTLHESDNLGFMDRLEKTLSAVHVKYYKPSAMKKLLETHGFHTFKMKVVPYRKSYVALIEDKGKYFNVEPENLAKFLEEATEDEKKPYELDSEGLTLFFTLIMTFKENNT